MMQRAFERQRRVGFSVLCVMAGLAVSAAFAQNTPAPAETAPPALAASPTPKPGKNPNKNPAKTPKAANPNKPMSAEIPIPLPIGELAKMISIPQVDVAGQLLSQLKAVQMKRLDEDHLEMQTMNLDLYQADGKSDFHIKIPTSIFNLKTRIIHSDEPVEVKTDDFELTGEKMEFDTVERTGKLMGKVRMIVHNLKKVAGQTDENKKP